MHLADGNFYPRAFLSMQVLTRDANGNPLTTAFYKKADFTELQFTWVQTWEDDKLDSWTIEFPA